MAVNLTKGAVSLMSKGAVKSAEDMKPILQVRDLKPVSNQNQQSNTERFRLLLSDGSQQQQGMLATQMNDLVKSGKLQIGSIVKLTCFICNNIQNRIIVIAVDLEVMLEKCDIIGEPEMPITTAAPIPSRVSNVEQTRKIAETKERVFIPPIPSDKQYSSKRCENLEKQIQSLKQNLSFMNRKDSVQTKQIEELQKQNQDLLDQMEALLEENEDFLYEKDRLLKENKEVVEEKERLLKEKEGSRATKGREEIERILLESGKI